MRSCMRSIFMGPGFESLPMQHDLFVGPGFDSQALIAQFRPGVSLAYVTHLNPYYPHKFIANRFSIVRPIHPYAGLLVCCVSHYTPPCFFSGLRYLRSNIFCSTSRASFFTPTGTSGLNCWYHIVAISHGHSCDVHRFGSWNALLLARTEHGFG